MLNAAKYLPRRIRLPLQAILILGFSWGLTACLHLAGMHITPAFVVIVYAATIGLVGALWGASLALLVGLICGVEFVLFVPAFSTWMFAAILSRWPALPLMAAAGTGLGLFARNLQLQAARSARQEVLRGFSAKLLHLQDEERRKIARELHDSLGQYLTAAKINLDLLRNNHWQRQPENDLQGKDWPGQNWQGKDRRVNLWSGRDPAGKDLLSEAQSILEQALVEVRTLSYLLHPPLLDEAGFLAVAGDYVHGFARRSGITASLYCSPDTVRLPQNVELALFRILQECLTNVHRHSGGRLVEVHLFQNPETVILEIKDDGRGMSPEILRRFYEHSGSAGVGLSGMHERAAELGGSLELRSGEKGTTVNVTIPLPKSGASVRQARQSYVA